VRRDVGSGNQESRFGLTWPKRSKLMQHLVTVDILYFDCVPRRFCRAVDLNQSIRTDRSVPFEPGFPLQHPGGQAGLPADRLQEAFRSEPFLVVSGINDRVECVDQALFQNPFCAPELNVESSPASPQTRIPRSIRPRASPPGPSPG